MNNSDAGNAVTFGGNDLDKISALLNGEPEVDGVDMNTTWNMRDSKCAISNPAKSFAYKFRSSPIIGNRDVLLPFITQDDEFLMKTAVQPNVVNKTFDAHHNAFLYMPKMPSIRKYGIAQCSDVAELGTGLLDGYMRLVSPTFVSDINGSRLRYSTGNIANTSVGIISFNAVICKAFNPRVRIKFALNQGQSSSRLYFGMSSLQILPETDFPLSPTDKGVMLGYRSTDTNFIFMSSDGVGSAATFIDTGVSAVTNAARTLELKVFDSNSTAFYSIDDSADIGVNSDIPDSSTMMYLNVVLQNTTTSSKDLDLFYAEIECDK